MYMFGSCRQDTTGSIVDDLTRTIGCRHTQYIENYSTIKLYMAMHIEYTSM